MGADADIFRRLSADEYYLNDRPSDKILQIRYDKQLIKVKQYLTKALNQSAKTLKNDNDKVDVILDRISELRLAITCKDISGILPKILNDFNGFEIGK